MAEQSGVVAGEIAERLAGKELRDGWVVGAKLPIENGGTGSTRSCCYVAHKDGRTAFLKAFDFVRALRDGTTDLETLVREYNHEVRLLRHCTGLRLNRVTAHITDGQVEVDGQVVHYIVSEYAEHGSVRERAIPGEDDVCAAARCRVLRDVASALRQLHQAGIAHQDVKPSNAVEADDGAVKLTDLGSASSQSLGAPPHDDLNVAGQPTYAPYELLYREIGGWETRRFGCDLFLLGNLAFTLFVGMPLNWPVLHGIPEDMRPGRFSGPYRDVLPDLRAAHVTSMEILLAKAPTAIANDLIEAVSQLCDPDPARRGHPRNVVASGVQFSLERYVSLFDRLAHKVELGRR